jgi:transposase
LITGAPNSQPVEAPIMRALDPEVVDAVWAAVEPLLPHNHDAHPLGCHRPRASHRLCLWGMLIRLTTGCSWVDVEAILERRVSDTTLRSRRDEWIAAGVFEHLKTEALGAYDRIIGLDLSEVSLDGSLHKAPCGGEGTGPNPTDRAKLGWKWSVAVDAKGIPLGWAIDGANRNDLKLLEPTLSAVATTGLLAEIDTLHLDRGYDYDAVRRLLVDLGLTDLVIQRRKRPGCQQPKQPLRLGLRWVVEGTNSWLSNYGHYAESLVMPTWR